MFEDTPEFVARHIIREAKSYLEGLRRRSSRRCWTMRRMAPIPGTARPLRRRGLPEEPGGPDVPPVLRREHAARRRLQRGGGTRPAARPRRRHRRERTQRRAHLQCRPLLLRHQRHQHLSNKMVWHHTVAPGDVVVVDRNCHKSILHSDHHDRGDPGVPEAHAQPLRHHRADSRRASSPPKPSRPRSANPLLKGVDADKVKPRVLTLTQSTYDGVLYNTETIKGMLDGYVDNLHFDEAWLPHAAFHPFYGTLPRHGQEARAAEERRGVCHPVHPQAAGRHQPGQPGAGAGLADHQAGPPPLQRGLPDAHQHQPAVQHHRQLRCGRRHDGAARRHGAGRGEHCRGAGFPPCHAQGGRGVRRRLVVQGLGPGKAGPPRASARPRLGAQGARQQVARLSASWPTASTCWTRSSAPSSRPAWT
jgi:hypothetical protein